MQVLRFSGKCLLFCLIEKVYPGEYVLSTQFPYRASYGSRLGEGVPNSGQALEWDICFYDHLLFRKTERNHIVRESKFFSQRCSM